jgi:hypothetical protein
VDAVVVCRGPEDGSYRSVVLVERSGMLTVEALAGVSVPAAPLFV